MIFDQVTSYYRGKKLSKVFTKTVTRKLVLGPFMFAKNETQSLLENEVFEASNLY